MGYIVVGFGGCGVLCLPVCFTAFNSVDYVLGLLGYCCWLVFRCGVEVACWWFVYCCDLLFSCLWLVYGFWFWYLEFVVCLSVC